MTEKSNPLLELPRSGASGCAQIFGWRSGSTFKRNLRKLPRIRKVNLRNGGFYILSDVFRARYPELSNSEIDEKVRAFVEDHNGGKQNKKHDWIGATESARIFGWRYGSSFKRNLSRLPKIQRIKKRRGVYFDLRDVFQACYPEASQTKLDELITDYRVKRAEGRLKGVRAIARHVQEEEKYVPSSDK